MLKVLEVNVDDHLYGGVYVLVKNVVKFLPDDIKADIAALEPFDNPEHIKEFNTYGSDVYYVGSDRNKLLKQLDIYRNVKKLIKNNQYDVVHLHSDISHKILVSALASKKAKAKELIFHSHASDAEGNHLPIRRAFHKLCCKALKRIPATYIATSEDAGKWMFPWADKKNIIVLGNGIDYQRFTFNANKRNDIRDKLGIKDEFVIGFFGRFVPPKNPFYTLEVVQAFVEKEKNIKLLCIGEGPLKEEFIQKTKDKGLEKHACFIEHAERIEDYYQAIDVLVVPSNFEGFGLVAVESQVSGTPTLVSNNIPSMVKISDLITFLPVGENDINLWCDALLKAKQHIKNDSICVFDTKYEMCEFVDKLTTIYHSAL